MIGGPGSRFRGVRDLISELALMPVEGGARVAIIEGAERMNEDAQSALLKTLEEPPAGVTIVLCADGEARLLPTVRSRCARVRLGLVGPRDIEAILARPGDSPIRRPRRGSGGIAGGRPGLALAYARAPEAVLIRAELTRLLLDFTDARPSARLAAARAAVPRAMALAAALEPAGERATAGPAVAPPRSGRARSAVAEARTPGQPTPSAEASASGGADRRRSATGAAPRTSSGRERSRRPSAVAQSSACSACGSRSPATSSSFARMAPGRSGTPSFSRSSPSTAAAIPPGSAEAFLDRGARAAELLAANVSPELILDSVVLAWPRRAGAAA